MKTKLRSLWLLMLLMGGASQAQNTVTVDLNAAWTGYANVFDNGVYQFGSAWALDAMLTTFNTADNAIELYPNYNTYNPADSYWSNGEMGNKTFEGNTFVENAALAGSSLTFTGMVNSNTLAAGYVAEAFIKGLNPANNYATDVYVHTPLVSGQAFSINAPNIPSGLLVQYGFSVVGLNGNPAHMAANGFASVTNFSLGVQDFASGAATAYPNPTTGMVNLSAAANIDDITVYNQIGQKVHQQSGSSTQERVDLSALPMGLYFAQMHVSGKSTTVRIQKQ